MPINQSTDVDPEKVHLPKSRVCLKGTPHGTNEQTNRLTTSIPHIDRVLSFVP